MAAAGLFALHNNVQRLAADHNHAKFIAEELLKKDFVGRMMPVETNIIIFEILSEGGPKAFCERMKNNDILCLPISEKQVRMVFHLDVHADMVKHVGNVIQKM